MGTASIILPTLVSAPCAQRCHQNSQFAQFTERPQDCAHHPGLFFALRLWSPHYLPQDLPSHSVLSTGVVFHLFCSTCPTRVRRLVQPTSPPCHRNTARPYFFKLLTFGTAATRGQTKPQPGKLLKGKRSSLRCDRRAVG